jgi:hypothetical protein
MASKTLNIGDAVQRETIEPKLITTADGATAQVKPPKKKYKLVAFYLEPDQNKALENLKNRLIQEDQGRDKSDLVREAIYDLLAKYKALT